MLPLPSYCFQVCVALKSLVEACAKQEGALTPYLQGILQVREGGGESHLFFVSFPAWPSCSLLSLLSALSAVSEPSSFSPLSPLSLLTLLTLLTLQ